MRSLFLNLVVFLVLGMTACQSSKKIARKKAVNKQSKESPLAVMFDTSGVFNSDLTGFVLYDPDADSVVYARNATRYFTPASNTKLFTFYAGLKLLPDSLRGLDYVIHGDSLIFWGTGDPSFLHPDFGNGKVYHFLKNSGKKLFYSDTNFRDRHLGPGWSWGDYNYYYSAEITPLPMYGNTASFKMQEITIKRVLKKDSSLSVSPSIFKSYVNRDSKRGARAPILKRGIDDNNFAYEPVADTTTYTVDKPYHYTPQLITKMLSDTLGRQVQYINRKEPEHTQAIYSIPADTAYKHMLLHSDNFIAEQLLLVTASELNMPLYSRSVIDYMKKHYLQDLPQEPQWVDGSGLSRYNLFTPMTMVRLLQKIRGEFNNDEDLFRLLPAGGVRGTIKNWYAAPDGEQPYVYAKTGTLSNNHCLSGFLITESGKKLIFSFMNNHYVTSSSVIKKEMQKVLWYIHTHYEK
ncbi:MAG TPA: D-alanyl-D-alanine carboxypeptidase/D-alanyl-D-alanine-endopeptidase [Balneolaceae bacterium]|nr:D-alanyl-D-alanine carboxypeptidase/D-alanyl-D-alanine-endopeptidase [Balneolaceae bacterium]